MPIAAISRWYGYAYGDGVRYFLNSERPTDEGIDTPLAFDFGLARTPPTDPSEPLFAETLASRAYPCEATDHTVKGYDRTPDYGAFCSSVTTAGTPGNSGGRARGARVAGLQREAGGGREPLPCAPEHGLQAAVHVAGRPLVPGNANWQPLLDRFVDHTLLGVENGVDTEPFVLTQGRSATQNGTGFRTEDAWPPSDTRTRRLFLTADGELARRASSGSDSFTDLSTSTEERSTRMPTAESDWLFQGKPLAEDTRMTGAARLELSLTVAREHAHLAPVLVVVAPDGTTKTVSRGFSNLLYRGGLATARDIPAGETIRATVTFKPQDQTFEAGHRIGVIVQGSNTVWALPDDPGASYTLGFGRRGSALLLPLS